ncbi:ABC transporter substrate-binding protein (plasmid) [Agrobacterium leguminum]|uniref:ABC transporter substrate-binding protein n=1 Tax=Agrobacterium leguminum TaxID=2792015 RepID=UPI0027298126|nr:ABC transporter substrate-binding protein [Agrobacterium leguminum]WLE00632.1 ABC transporter substrate-binding protein [Agrobacterium leguminum]
MKRTIIGLVACTGMLLATTAHADVTLTVLVDSVPETAAAMDVLTRAYTELNPEVTFDIEHRASGGEGDNVIKTRLAIDEMPDIFNYNPGSLFRALKPEQKLVDLSDLPSQAGINPVFKLGVTSDDGSIRGVPYGPVRGGGIFYNKKVYADLGLQVTRTWAQFMENNRKIHEAKIVPVVQTYGAPWTSQILFLGDFFNVQAAEPNFAKEFTANQAKFSTTPTALRSFEHIGELKKADYFNADFGAATVDEGFRMVAGGQAAHYPMLSHGVRTLLNKAKKFVNWVASVDGCSRMIKAVGATGPR